MNYLIIVLLCCLFAIPGVAICLYFGDTIKDKISNIIVLVVVAVAMTSILLHQDKVNAEKWNSGYCECGTHWELQSVTRTKMGTETEYYTCPNCYKEIKINH